MVRLSTAPADNPLAVAKGLAGLGFNVLPARYKDKSPQIPWTKYQSTRTDHLLTSWFGGSGQRNFWIMTGRMSGIIVIDCDTEAGDKWWRDRIGDLMDATAKVKTRKGYHYYFKIPEDWPEDKVIQSWSVHPKEDDKWEESFDVRADGTGVIGAGSVHETGHHYTWVLPEGEDDPSAAIQEAPPRLLGGEWRAEAPQSGSTSGGGTSTSRGGTTRSMLSALLGNPPTGEGSGRNDWLARVAGHYAKTYHNQEDLYRAHVEQANDSMAEPLDNKEFEKTVASIWKGEHERNTARALDGDCGWLQDGGFVIMTQVVLKTAGDEAVYDLAPYSNFNILAKGVMIDDDGQRTYWTELVAKRAGGHEDRIDAVLPASVAGDDRKLRVWLASYGVQVLEPDNLWPKTGSPSLRIQRYLESQQPPVVKISNTLGWDAEILSGAGGFITHDGVITATDVLETNSCGVRADPQLQTGGLAPHHYGFENDGIEAKRVLREVLTFHDDEITSVFGAWWAACLVKPQIEEYSSLFPFVAIEAASESGKTNGFFDMLVQLNGNTRGESQSTKAALRDMAAAHKSGIVWIDDMDDPGPLMELLRAATSGGTLTKMSEDRASVKNARIVSPIVISGEQLGMSTQKALIDRAIMIHATSPTSRMSLHDPDRPQWDDILELRERYPRGLSALAGWIVQDALSQTEHVIAAMKAGRKGVAGRAADKVAVLRAGAKLLDYLVSEHPANYRWEVGGRYTQRVEDYLEARPITTSSNFDNALTLHVLPWALRQYDYPEKPYAKRFVEGVHTPVFVKSPDGVGRSVKQILKLEPEDAAGIPEIWYSVPFLAQAWSQHKRGMIDKRTESEGALKQQADAIRGMGPGRQVRITGSGARGFYRVISGPLVLQILARAEGTE
jgi:hypothetical protein